MLRWLRAFLVSIPLILIFTVYWTTLAVAGSLVDRQGRFAGWCKQHWARMLLAASFVRVSVEGAEKFDPRRPLLFCSNHLSYMDPPVVLASLPFAVSFVAKRSLFAIPFLGWGMRRAGEVAIDRSNPRASARSLRGAAEAVRQGASLVVFPEGSRSLDGTLQAFHSGAFRLAIAAQVPVVPLAIWGTREVLAPGSLWIRGGRVRLRVADPIPTSGMTARDIGRLRTRVRQVIEDMLAGTPDSASGSNTPPA